MSQSELEKKFKIKTNFFECLQFRQSIPIHWRTFIRNNFNKEILHDVACNNLYVIDKLLSNKNRSKIMYWNLIQKKLIKPSNINYWEKTRIFKC